MEMEFRIPTPPLHNIISAGGERLEDKMNLVWGCKFSESGFITITITTNVYDNKFFVAQRI